MANAVETPRTTADVQDLADKLNHGQITASEFFAAVERRANRLVEDEARRSVPNTPGTPRRTIRVPDSLWDAAAAKAAERGESLSDVLRRALERYVKRR